MTNVRKGIQSKKTNKYAMYLHIVQNAKAQVETVLDILNLETDGKNDKPL